MSKRSLICTELYDALFTYAGSVETGFGAAVIQDLLRKLEPLEVDARQFLAGDAI